MRINIFFASSNLDSALFFFFFVLDSFHLFRIVVKCSKCSQAIKYKSVQRDLEIEFCSELSMED